MLYENVCPFKWGSNFKLSCNSSLVKDLRIQGMWIKATCLLFKGTSGSRLVTLKKYSSLSQEQVNPYQFHRPLEQRQAQKMGNWPTKLRTHLGYVNYIGHNRRVITLALLRHRSATSQWKAGWQQWVQSAYPWIQTAQWSHLKPPLAARTRQDSCS